MTPRVTHTHTSSTSQSWQRFWRRAGRGQGTGSRTGFAWGKRMPVLLEFSGSSLQKKLRSHASPARSPHH